MQKLLVIAGLLLVVTGISWPLISRLGLGRLPGDIAVRGENGAFYFPIVSCIVISVVLSFLLWLFGKF